MNVIIRPEITTDHLSVEKILLSAFPTNAESRLVNEIRINGNATISLVAVSDDNVIGHILFSPVTTDSPTQSKGIGLAPVAVDPIFRSQGIGSKLIHTGLQVCHDMHFDYVVVLGDPKYYTRFGFEKAGNFGLQNEYGVEDEFMVIKFTLVPVSGLVRYSSEFSLLSVCE